MINKNYFLTTFALDLYLIYPKMRTLIQKLKLEKSIKIKNVFLAENTLLFLINTSKITFNLL